MNIQELEAIEKNALAGAEGTEHRKLKAALTNLAAAASMCKKELQNPPKPAAPASPITNVSVKQGDHPQ